MINICLHFTGFMLGYNKIVCLKKRRFRMLYMIVSKHSPESCPVANITTREKLVSANQHLNDVTKALGVNVIGTWTDMPAHMVFMLVDAPKPEALSKMAVELHLADWNTSITHPIITLQEAMTQLQQQKTNTFGNDMTRNLGG